VPALANPIDRTTAMTHKRFVLLDRDGTINRERHYLSHPDQVELCPNAGQGMRRMLELGLGLVVVTNQSGITRGYFDEPRLHEIHDRLRFLLRLQGVLLHGIYHCPHGPDARCGCRKPEPGLAERAAGEFGFELSESFVIGDKPCDIDLGRAVAATTILVRTGYGADHQSTANADFVVDDLTQAAQVIESCLRREAKGQPSCHPVTRRLWGQM
jgi:D-glycero-D-manno-heptose 1,7-bisphosphate phosphatase